jgi:2-polyprenyl-6-hydroxyphenyl methylase / 3-demethylubiquinone-9 3-methyltransferase
MSTEASSTAKIPDNGRTVDPAEVERFRRIAKEWWDPEGKFRPLHQIGPARLKFIRDEIIHHFKLEAPGADVLAGLKVLDVGCGGGLISEPLARLGASVTGIDPAEQNISVARSHAEPQNLNIDYRAATVEGLSGDGAVFDVVVCLEVVEHVPDVGAFVKECARLARPGGLVILSTINRTFKSFALAIVGAEYVLGWLPRGTHRWDRFVTTDELEGHLTSAGTGPVRFMGFAYHPLRDEWQLDPDTSVNYLAAAPKPS